MAQAAELAIAAGTSSSMQNVAESAPHISYCMYPASACTVSWCHPLVLALVRGSGSSG